VPVPVVPVPVVPQSLSCATVTTDAGSAGPFYDMNAAFMSFQPHESGIHAVRSGAGEGSVTEVRFRCAQRPAARRERTTINLARNAGASGATRAHGGAAGGDGGTRRPLAISLG
jgi:hypothetical protein